MGRPNDQIFQLSLTELAFSVAFILLLLLGYLVAKEQAGRLSAEAALARVHSTDRATAALILAKSDFAAALQNAGTTNPDGVITKLIAGDDLRADRDLLKQRVEQLDAKLTALTALQVRLDKVAESSRPHLMIEQIGSALSLQAQVRKSLEEQHVLNHGSSADSDSPVSEDSTEDILRVKQDIVAAGELRRQLKIQLGSSLDPGQEAETVREVVAAAKNLQSLAKSSSQPSEIEAENSNLRGQVAFLRNRLTARGGRDFPPCWVDQSGKVEFLFSVETRSDSVLVTAAWPQRRDTAARGLPGVTDALSGPHSRQDFGSSIQGIFNWSKGQHPECRHYVQLKSSISDAIESDRARLMVENYFYKVEVRR